MNNLPFHRWTFKFHNLQHEQLFESFTDKVRLTVFKILICFLGILGFVFLMQFIIQQENYILNIILSIAEILMFFMYFASERLVSSLKYVNLIIYVVIFTVGCAVVLSGFKIQTFLYGYVCSCVSLPAIQYSHYRIKISIIMLFPAIYLFAFNAYTLYNITFIITLFLSQALFAVQLYYNEYFLRLSFSFYQITQRQKEILEEYTSDPLFAISFDKRTQQFVPEFANYEFRKQFQDLDTNYLKQFLRMTKIEPNTSVNQSADFNHRKFEKKNSTLEELCYVLINSEAQFRSSNFGKIEKNSGQPNKKFSIEIQKVFLTQSVLLVSVKHGKNFEIQEQNEQKIQYYKNLINNFAVQVMEQSEKLNQKQFFKTGNQGKSNQQSQNQYIFLLILNKIRNFWILINNGTIKSQQFKIQKVNLKQYLNNIENYFENIGKTYEVSFKMQNYLEENFNLFNSIEMVSQILFNLYELSIKNSKKRKIITLEIYQNDVLNPQQFSQYSLISDYPCEDNLNDQFLITFKFSFFSEKNLDLKPKKQISLNPRTLEDYQYNGENQFDIVWPVSCFALGRIGPYSEIETRKALFSTELEMEIYYYQMIFKIYSKCSQLDQSFINYVKE